MINCRQFTELSGDHLDGGATFSDRLSMIVHQILCKHCRRFLDQMRLSDRILGLSDDTPPPAEEVERILASLPGKADSSDSP